MKAARAKDISLENVVSRSFETSLSGHQSDLKE
jgi:hypothetical protein